jgi:hypothetical protein
MRMGSCEAWFVIRVGTKPSNHGHDSIDEYLCAINSIYYVLEDNHHRERLHFTE